VRYCPICDGYEAIDKRIGVVGGFEAAARKALFLRTFSKQIYVFSEDASPRPPDLMAELRAASVTVLPRPLQYLRSESESLTVVTTQGSLELDVLYPALGCDVRSSLAAAVGAKTTQEGTVIVDGWQQTTVPGLYAAGDVVTDLHQLSVAMGHAAVAATRIHNQLCRNLR
jgi:thioredoxin reductase (NADPH)